MTQEFFSSSQNFMFHISLLLLLGYAAAQLVEAPRYEPESGGFHSRWCHSFNTVVLVSTQPLKEMNSRNISLVVKKTGA
jgi:hypothetical protein